MRINKFLLTIMMFFVIITTGCSKPVVTPLESSDADMSDYELNINNSVYRLITPETFLKAFEDKATCVIYIGYGHCSYCREAIPSLTKAAEDYGATVYYLDCYNEDHPLVNEYFEKLKEVLYDCLSEDETGEKAVFTPHVIVLVDGEIKHSIVGLGENYNYDEASKQSLYELYCKMMSTLYTKK